MMKAFMSAIDRGDLEAAQAMFHGLPDSVRDLARPHLAALRDEGRATRHWADQSRHYREHGRNGDTITTLRARGTRR